jgi:hypothetical protein
MFVMIASMPIGRNAIPAYTIPSSLFHMGVSKTGWPFQERASLGLSNRHLLALSRNDLNQEEVPMKYTHVHADVNTGLEFRLQLKEPLVG